MCSIRGFRMICIKVNLRLDLITGRELNLPFQYSRLYYSLNNQEII